MDFTVPSDHIVKIKEIEKRGKYLDIARELKQLWTIKVQTDIGTLGTISESLVKELEELEIRGRVEIF